jgi:glycosyltransferase involved in cell wall biosynthesis
VIANGIDTDAYSPIGAGSSDGQPVIIGMASRITGIKRHDLLIDAMAVLRNQGGRIDWRLSLAGDGDTLAALQAKVSELQLDDIVAFPGYLGENELKQWFNTLDIYAHASEGETLSTSILQALAMGLPIVGSDVAGISNLLAEGNGAGLVVAQTPEAFANAFRRINDEPGLADDMRRRARHLAVNKYSQARMFRSYDQLLERLCAK